MSRLHLVLGGARSGKSRFAEQAVVSLASTDGLSKVYVATATAIDDEMQKRIDRHKKDRVEGWSLIEEPLDLALVISKANPKDCLLIECLTVWMGNCMHHDCWAEKKRDFITALSQSSVSVTLVSNEVGQGIVPANALARQFIDESGWLHQELAALCGRVSFVTAGIPQTLKDSK